MRRVLLLIAATELSAYGVLAVAGWITGQPIPTVRRIYAEQTQRIVRLLEGAGSRRDEVDPSLGWRYRPGYSSVDENVNAQGLRSRREYDRHPAAGVLRVAVFGDSMVYGTEVRDEEAWAAVAEATDPTLEVLNYGVGGYGTDQAYLRFVSQGALLEPHVAVLGFTPVDLRRNVNVYRRFLDPRASLAVKPRFVLDGGDLRLLPGPIRQAEDWREFLEEPGAVRRWGKNDSFYEPAIYDNPLHDLSGTARLASHAWVRWKRRRPMGPGSEAFEIQLRLYERFFEQALDRGQSPLLLMLPDARVLDEAAASRRTRFDDLIDAVATGGNRNRILDATEAFAPAFRTGGASPSWFAPGGHYSVEGSRLVGHWFARELARRFDGALTTVPDDDAESPPPADGDAS